MASVTGTDSLQALEQRVQRVEDVQAIQSLMAMYGRHVDDSYNLDGLRQILDQNLEWTSNSFGSYSGLDEYLAGQVEISKTIEWAFHVMAPVQVTVSDDGTAQGTFYLLMLATFLGEKGEKVPIILSARYENEFAKDGETWKCSRMNVHFQQVSPVTEGWVEVPFWGA